MTYPSSLSAKTYITKQFSAYCKSHMGNPVAPFRLYKDFLAHAQEKGNFGWMRLAKQHRQHLLQEAFKVQAKVYGYDTIKKLADD